MAVLMNLYILLSVHMSVLRGYISIRFVYILPLIRTYALFTLITYCSLKIN